MKKKLLIVTAVLLVVCLAVGGIYYVLRANRDPAKVYPVAEISEENSDDYENVVGGEVRTDRLQTVYVSQTQEITEILVQEGDQVKKGDPLLCYNTTLSELQVERKRIELQKLEQDLEKAQKEYRSYFGTNYEIPGVVPENGESLRSVTPAALLAAAQATGLQPELSLLTQPVPRKSETPGPETTEATGETEPPTEPTEPSTEPTEPSTEPTEPTETEAGESVEEDVVLTYYVACGDGSEEEPWRIIVASDYAINERLIRSLLRRNDPVYVIFAQTEEDRIDGLVVSAWGMILTPKDESWTFSLTDAGDCVGLPVVPETPEEDPEPMPEPEPDPWYPSGPTWQELQEIRKELQEKIRDLDLNIRMGKVDLASMEKELGDGMVYAELDGVVMGLIDPETAAAEDMPMLKVSGGGGYTITANVSELQLADVQIGQTVRISSWYGDVYEGTVESISEYPASADLGGPGINVSWYPVNIIVDASANLAEAYWVDVNLGGGSAASDTFYLFKAFVLNENGKSYVYVKNEEALLEKRFLTTGRDLYGYELEILDGLSREDYVAFPYAKTTEVGAKTEVGNLTELSGY